MFHPGKVIRVFSYSDKGINSCDQSTQAFLEMWDENQMTFQVDPKIADKVKPGDFVLVDYSSGSMQYPMPRYIIIKVLSQEMGKETWKNYKEYLVKLKERNMPSQSRAQSYVG